MRIGMGYDVHRLTEGRDLILGGVRIPYEKGLLGHSDADVLLHAIMDAMLGAAALGDIGKHFPDTDPAYKGISSIRLLEHVGELLKKEGDVSLVAVMAVNNETGCVQPAMELAEAAHAHGAYFFSDCVQAASCADLKALADCCDAISLSAHKVGGPKGMGVLVVKKGVRLTPLISGGEQERGLRGGTSNVAGAVGFAAALELAQKERAQFVQHTDSVRTLFEQRIFDALGGEVRADGERRCPNISHLTFEHGGTAFTDILDLAGVACSRGAACSSHSAKPSHVLMAMGRSAEESLRGVRFSFGMQTSEKDAADAAQIVIESYRKFKGGIS